MARGRVGFGIALLFAFAGTAAAQPNYGSAFGGPFPPGPAPSTPGMLPASMQAGPSTQPQLFPGNSAPPVSIQPVMPADNSIQTLSAFADNAPPMRDITPANFEDLIPPPAHGGHGHGNGHGCDHCGEGHEIPGFMTPFVPEHACWYTSAEFLLMRPRNSDFDFVIPANGTGLATNGPIESFKYGQGTGFRAEVGRNWGKWETGFAYSYFTSGDTSTIFAGTGQVLLPTLTRPGLTDRALTATGNADLDYNLFDAIAARRILIDDNVGVRLFAGGRFTDIRQTLNAFYDGADARQAAVNSRSQFKSFGPIVGAELVLAGWKGCHFYSRATGGLLVGRSTNELVETNDNGATTYINTHYDVRKVVPMTSVAIGGGWQYRTISIRAGYEVTYLHGVFERPRFVDDVSQGKVITRPANLTLDGLFIQVGLTY